MEHTGVQVGSMDWLWLLHPPRPWPWCTPLMGIVGRLGLQTSQRQVEGARLPPPRAKSKRPWALAGRGRSGDRAPRTHRGDQHRRTHGPNPQGPRAGEPTRADAGWHCGG